MLTWSPVPLRSLLLNLSPSLPLYHSLYHSPSLSPLVLSLSPLPHSHNRASNPTMHTKLATREAPVPSSQNSQLPPEPQKTVTPTVPIAHEVENLEEGCPPNSSEPSSPGSEDDFSSGGEQMSYQEDPKSFMHPQFSGNNQYYVMSLPNGMGGAGTDGMMSTALPNTAWGSTNDAGMPEGMKYVCDNCLCTYIPSAIRVSCRCLSRMHSSWLMCSMFQALLIYCSVDKLYMYT